MFRKNLPYLAFFVLCTTLTAMLWLKPKPGTESRIGNPFPTLSNRLISGDPITGGFRIYNFFASWCAPCLAELPTLRTLKEQTSLPIIGLSWDQNDDASRQWIATHKPPFDVVYDDRSGILGHEVSLRGLPETFLVDDKGVILHHHPGYMTEKDITPFVDALAKAKR